MHHLTKYPYAELGVNDTVTLNFKTKGDAVKARVAAHTYGQWCDKRFRTSITGSTIEVRRVV